MEFLRPKDKTKTRSQLSIESKQAVLKAGQPFYDIKDNKLYIGDGKTQLQSLSPVLGAKGPTGDRGPTGPTGAEGLGIFYASSTSIIPSTTSISIAAGNIPTGRKIKIGDLIVGNANYSYLFKVNSVSSSSTVTTATVSYLTRLKGDDGNSGQGTVGPTGASAYDIWKLLGNTGSEQDFIDSLKGEPGEDGKQGPPGLLDEEELKGLYSLVPENAQAITGSSSVNLDSFVTPGNYYCADEVSSIDQVPKEESFQLKVERIFPLDSGEQANFDAAGSTDKIKYCGYLVQTFTGVSGWQAYRTTRWYEEGHTYVWLDWISPTSNLYSPDGTKVASLKNINEDGDYYLLPDVNTSDYSGAFRIGSGKCPIRSLVCQELYTQDPENNSNFTKQPYLKILNSSGTQVNLDSIIIQL